MTAATHPPTRAFSAEAAEGGGLNLKGALELATARLALATLLARLPASGSLSVDLSGLESSDSAGLAVLVEWRAEACSRGVHLRLCRPPAGLQALARLSDLEAELFA